MPHLQCEGPLVETPFVSIVDDDASVREATGGLLRSLGYAVREFGSASEFLASGALDGFACVITDLSMPGMSGFELQASLTRSGRSLPIIFVTAFATEQNRARALGAGAVGFLAKPLQRCQSDRVPGPRFAIAPALN